MSHSLTGFQYQDRVGRTVTVLGYDGLFPDGERVLVGANDGLRWSVRTELIELVKEIEDGQPSS